MRSTAIRGSVLALALFTAVAATATAQSARLRPEGSGAASPDGPALFKEAATREAALRRELSAAKSGATAVTQRRVRTLVGSFEDLARLFPAAGQADKALWQGASLSADLFFQTGDELDRDRALQMLAALQKAFPGSSYARQAAPLALRLEGGPRAVRAPATPPPPALVPAAPSPASAIAPPAPRPAIRAQTGPETAVAGVLLTAVRRDVLPEAVRITLELDREVTYHSERIQGPERVFVDLPHTRAVPALKFAVMPFEDGVVRRARIGAHPGGITRVVLDLEGAGRHSVYTLYNPYRIVVDVEQPAVSRAPATPPAPAHRHHRRSWNGRQLNAPSHRPPRWATSSTPRQRQLRRPPRHRSRRRSMRAGDSRCHGSSGSGSRGSSSTPVTAATTPVRT